MNGQNLLRQKFRKLAVAFAGPEGYVGGENHLFAFGHALEGGGHFVEIVQVERAFFKFQHVETSAKDL